MTDTDKARKVAAIIDLIHPSNEGDWVEHIDCSYSEFIDLINELWQN